MKKVLKMVIVAVFGIIVITTLASSTKDEPEDVTPISSPQISQDSGKIEGVSVSTSMDVDEQTPNPVSTKSPTPASLSTPNPTIVPAQTSKPKPTTPITPSPNKSQNSNWTCNCSKTCTEISSCAEAQYQLNTCGCRTRDADHDGIACDSAPLNCQN